MTDRKHTPGPWYVGQPMAPNYDFSPICAEGTNEYHATAVYSGDGVNTTANARLIAAAPDMYEALKFILPRILGELHPDHPEHKIVMAALDKAEGSAALSQGQE